MPYSYCKAGASPWKVSYIAVVMKVTLLEYYINKKMEINSKMCLGVLFVDSRFLWLLELVSVLDLYEMTTFKRSVFKQTGVNSNSYDG